MINNHNIIDVQNEIYSKIVEESNNKKFQGPFNISVLLILIELEWQMEIYKLRKCIVEGETLWVDETFNEI